MIRPVPYLKPICVPDAIVDVLALAVNKKRRIMIYAGAAIAIISTPRGKNILVSAVSGLVTGAIAYALMSLLFELIAGY